jgi:hypothetical protein
MNNAWQSTLLFLRHNIQSSNIPSSATLALQCSRRMEVSKSDAAATKKRWSMEVGGGTTSPLLLPLPPLGTASHAGSTSPIASVTPAAAGPSTDSRPLPNVCGQLMVAVALGTPLCGPGVRERRVVPSATTAGSVPVLVSNAIHSECRNVRLERQIGERRHAHRECGNGSNRLTATSVLQRGWLAGDWVRVDVQHAHAGLLPNTSQPQNKELLTPATSVYAACPPADHQGQPAHGGCPTNSTRFSAATASWWCSATCGLRLAWENAVQTVAREAHEPTIERVHHPPAAMRWGAAA